MPSDQSSAVVAICCRLPEGSKPDALEDWMRPVRSARVAVTWIVGPADLEVAASHLAGRGEQDRLAVDVPSEWLTGDARQSLIRQRFAAIHRVSPSLDTVVVRSPRNSSSQSAIRPELLVEQGIRLVATNDVGWHGRRSRRPGPPGWACSSPAWGLWEVGFAPRSQRGWLSGILPLVLGPRLEPGRLSVIQAGQTAGQSKRDARMRFERILHWVARCTAARRPRAETVTLSQLASMLASGTAGGGHRSVLAA